jgi:PadR family transcriptional regulator PadR
MVQHGRDLVERRFLLPAYLLLLLAEEPGHGYELAERLRRFGFDLSGPGPVYRELRRLEELGLARSSWSAPASGPIPRVYRLTAEGKRRLASAADGLAEVDDLVHTFRERHRALLDANALRSRRRRESRSARTAVGAAL